MKPVYGRIARNAVHKAALFAFCSSLPLTAGAALAQESPVIEEGSDVIIVSARRRDESLQDVPIAVSAFTGDQLKTIGVVDLTDIEAITPNVTLETSRGANNTITAFIRGVGQQDPVAGFESGVGIYVDDIYLNRPQAALLDVYDVERIEVLRGPQGTLYGRNTIGGAVKYVTRELTNEPEASLRLTGGTFGQFDVVAGFGLPVLQDSAIGDLQIGGTIGYFRRNGFGANLNIDGLDNYNKDILAGRLALEWEPSDRIWFRVAGDWTDDNSNPRQGHRLLDFPGFPVLDNVFDTRAGLNTPEQSVVARGVSVVSEWQATDNITFKNILGYRYDRSESPIDFDSLPLVDLDVPVIYENEQFSEEFQVLYESDRLNGLVGFYYLNANAFNEFDVLLFEQFGPGVNSYSFGDVDTKTWSVFGNLTYDLTDTVALEFGGRYTSDERSSTVWRQLRFGSSPSFGGPNPPIVLGGLTPIPFEGSETFTEFDPRASISWSPTDEYTLYFSYAEGFKGGGFDPRGGTVGVPDVDGDGEGLLFNGVPDFDDEFATLLFEPEEIATYEVGIKTSFYNGRWVNNLAAFYSDYENVQIPGSAGVDFDNDGVADDFNGFTTNAAAATLFGIEVDGYATLAEDMFHSGDSLTYNYTLGYINAEFDEFLGASVDNMPPEDISDQAVFQNTPAITAYSMLTYAKPMSLLGRDGDASIFGSFSYRSETHQFNFESPIDQPGFVLLNAGLNWATNDGRLQLSVHGTNLLDKEYIVAGYDFVSNQQAFASTPLGSTGVLTAFFGNPRQVFGTVEVAF